MKTLKPAFRFRLHPNRGRCYFDVRVWNNARDIQKFTGIKCCAVVKPFECTSFKRNGKTHRKSIVGEIHFCRGALGVGVVSHEMTHAGLAYLDHRGINLQRDNLDSRWVHNSEEQLADAVGSLVRLFVIKAYALGIYTGGATVQTVRLKPPAISCSTNASRSFSKCSIC